MINEIWNFHHMFHNTTALWKKIIHSVSLASVLGYLYPSLITIFLKENSPGIVVGVCVFASMGAIIVY